MGLIKKRLLGFTLVELLVVISIISLLSSVTFSSLNQARAKARDVERIATVNQILLALKLYHERYGKFPCMHWSYSNDDDYLQPLLDEGLLTKRPTDPLAPDYFITYITYSDTVGGECGKIVHIDVDFETLSGTCPYGKIVQGETHCHIFFPKPLPPPCTYPYQEIWPDPVCESLQDTTSDY